MQSDPEPSIRTNTCILLGRLAPLLGYNTKRKVLVPAFARALKDPFVHARVAGLMAFMAAIDCFEIEELAAKVILNVSPLMVDGEKLRIPYLPSLQSVADVANPIKARAGSGLQSY
jgi:SCY1-like protein 1